MDVGEFKEILANVPDTAVIYIEADHGQSPEQGFNVYATDEEFDGDLPYDGEDINWNDICDCVTSKIKAVMISY